MRTRDTHIQNHFLENRFSICFCCHPAFIPLHCDRAIDVGVGPIEIGPWLEVSWGLGEGMRGLRRALGVLVEV